jgi:putative inorganic carbon (HCO3(-)) transporter
MPKGSELFDYEPVTRSRRGHPRAGETISGADWPQPASIPTQSSVESMDAGRSPSSSKTVAPVLKKQSGLLKRGHALSYLGLFLFTTILYFRPYELIPALSDFSSMAFVVALLTLGVFFPSQVAVEGTLTARPREVNLVLLLCLTCLLSIPLAINRWEAWETFSGNFLKVIIMFIVMVNTVRTERRLKWLILLSLAISCMMSIGALNDFAAGKLTVDGYRVDGFKAEGARGNLFGNPNDMALHLVTMVPLALAFFLSRRDPFRKLLYLASAILMVGGITVTFSRAGFLGLVSGMAVMAWKIGRRRRLAVMLSVCIFAVAFIAFAPGGFANRLGSIVDHSRDPVHSANARQALLVRSIVVSAMHPLLGVGMGNFHIVSIREAVTHNAYTQVSSELGLTALIIYVMFIVTPIKKLRQIEDRTFETRRGSRFYYMAVALQASLVGYMVSSFFASVAYHWYVYYLVGYAVALWRIYEAAPEAKQHVAPLAVATAHSSMSQRNGSHGQAIEEELEAAGRVD